MLLLIAGSASAEIMRCTDNTGSTTFTDAACTTGSHRAQVPPAVAAATAVSTFSGKKKFAAAENARSLVALNHISRGINYSLDERTVRGAKALTDSMDIASDLARRQAAAEKALQTNRWAFWRS